MGLGDWVMASADVREANESTGQKVYLGDGKNAYYEAQIFDGNPRMARDGEPGVWVENYPGKRPYIKASKNGRLYFNDNFRPKPGELFVDASEKLKGKILVETRVNPRFIHTQNKAWPYWDELLKQDLPFITVESVKTESFRDALSLLKGASLFVGTDGALHHAAAALGVQAVVIWTGYSSPAHLGYDSQVNIHDGSEPCGSHKGVCPHCLKKAKAISPEYVYKVVKSEYARSSRL